MEQEWRKKEEEKVLLEMLSSWRIDCQVQGEIIVMVVVIVLSCKHSGFSQERGHCKPLSLSP
jgi:hypothetical protein